MSSCQQLWSLSATDIVELLRTGQVSPLELIGVAQQRTEATDHVINAIPIRCFDKAREEAIKLQERGHPTEKRRGYLYGLPVLIKDLTAAKGLLFTRGSPIYRNYVAKENDPLVDQIEACGGIVIGKSNVPEFGAGAQTYNTIFGVTTNPWDTSLTAGGSSGGSAAALAAGQVWLATGTDLGGSQRIPASFCGVVGLRPSVGLVPQHYSGGKMPTPEAPELHSVSGPLARNVPDLALLLDAMAGEHYRDPLSKPPPEISFSESVLPGRLPPPRRIAWTRDLGGIVAVDTEVADLVQQAANWFRCLGSEVIEACPDMSDIDEFHGVLRALRFRNMSYLLEDPACSQTKAEVLSEIRYALSMTEDQIQRAVAAHKAYVDRVLIFLQNFDLLLSPAVIIPPFDAKTSWPREANGKKFSFYYEWMKLSYAISVVPVPVLSLPIGNTREDLPVGMQIVGLPNCECQLLAAAASYERAHNHSSRVPLEPRQIFRAAKM